MVERKEYFNKLLGYKDKKIIKVITGVRRCGKSTLLQMFQDHLLGSGIDEDQILSINFEDCDYDYLRNPQELHNYIKGKLIPDKTVYIFLDEIQNVDKFQRVVDSLFLRNNVDIYLTGSNAYMLSGELATLLSGRYIKIDMLPLSFSEFVSARLNSGNMSVDELYLEYLETSSFPFTLSLINDIKQIKDYLRSIYDTIVVKDIINRKSIADIMMLESVLRFLMDNIGSQLSTKKICDSMTSNGRRINFRTVESYVTSFIDSYIVYEAKRFDIKGRQYLKTLEKYYVVDIGLRNTMSGARQKDTGHILENVIYLELIRRGYDVYIGKIEDVEVDFVCEHETGFKYIQVAASVRDENTLARELRSLDKIDDHYPKYIMTLDRDPIADYKGIKRINAIDYLLHKIDI